MLSYKGLTLVRNLGRTRASDPFVLVANPKGFNLGFGAVVARLPQNHSHRPKR